MRYMTVDRAREEIDRLQQYVDLVESYEDDTLEKFIIKKYALTGNLEKTLDLVHSFGFGMLYGVCLSSIGAFFVSG